MKKYHLFAIKKEIYYLYKNKEYSLFKIIYNLYNMNKIDLKYGITIYNQICEIINIKKLNEYLEITKNIKGRNNKYLISDNNQKIILIIKPSHIIYCGKITDNKIGYLLSNYHKYIFVCDLKTKEFFWLNNKISIEINKKI